MVTVAGAYRTRDRCLRPLSPEFLENSNASTYIILDPASARSYAEFLAKEGGFTMRTAQTLLLLVLIPAIGLTQNIVSNPGFENATASPWVLSTYGGVGQPWAIGTSFFGLGPASGSKVAATGCNSATNCLFPDPSPVGAWLYQDLATTANTTYALSFQLSPGLGAGGRTELQVLWGNSATPLTVGATGTCGGNCVYRNTTRGTRAYSLVTVSNLTATSNSMRLEFLGVQQPDVIGIDGVCVGTGTTCVAVPATVTAPALQPWALAALAAGLLATGLLVLRAGLRA